MQTVAGPPDALVRALVDGPGPVRGVDWLPVTRSTNEVALDAARAGAPEVHVVAADVQTAGRGRLGRRWDAPPGTSLLCSLLLRPPPARASDVALLPLLAGLAVAEVASRYAPDVALKWPNDLLVGGSKAGGVLGEAFDGAVVVGIGVNVDWRGVARPPDLGLVSLAEAGDRAVDRWRVLAAVLGILGRAYEQWCEDPTLFLPAYRERCATLGQSVRVTAIGGDVMEATATDVAADGALLLDSGAVVRAGDVEHVRPASR